MQVLNQEDSITDLVVQAKEKLKNLRGLQLMQEDFLNEYRRASVNEIENFMKTLNDIKYCQNLVTKYEVKALNVFSSSLSFKKSKSYISEY